MGTGSIWVTKIQMIPVPTTGIRMKQQKDRVDRHDGRIPWIHMSDGLGDLNPVELVEYELGQLDPMELVEYLCWLV